MLIGNLSVGCGQKEAADGCLSWYVQIYIVMHLSHSWAVIKDLFLLTSYNKLESYLCLQNLVQSISEKTA
jgi:hypothetical protein